MTLSSAVILAGCSAAKPPPKSPASSSPNAQLQLVEAPKEQQIAATEPAKPPETTKPSAPPQPDLRFEPNVPFSPFMGTDAEKAEKVDWVVSHANNISPIFLYAGAATAYRLQRLTDAAYLFYVGNLRIRWDLAAFPPVGTGGDSPTVLFSFLKQNAGQVINPVAMSDAKLMREILPRLEQWTPLRDEGYDPVYEHGKVTPKSAEALKEFPTNQAEYLRDLSRQVSLVEQPEYFRCLRMVQHHGLEAKSPITDKAFKRALERLEQIDLAYPASAPAVAGPAACDDHLIDPKWRPSVRVQAAGEQIALPPPQ